MQRETRRDFGSVLLSCGLIVAFALVVIFVVDRVPFLKEAFNQDLHIYPQESMVYLDHHNYGTFVVDRVSILEDLEKPKYEALERIATVNTEAGKINAIRISKDGKYVITRLMLEFNNELCPHEWMEVKNGKMVNGWSWAGTCG